MKRVTAIVSVLLLSTALGGCVITDKIKESIGEAIVENVLEQGTDSDIDVDYDDDESVTFTTDDGDGSVTAQGGLPDDFPTDVPIVSHSKDIGVTTIRNPEEGMTAFSVMITSDKSYANTKEFYLEEMESEGWNQDSEIETGDMNTYIYSKQENTCQLSVIEEDGEVKVAMTVMIKE